MRLKGKRGVIHSPSSATATIRQLAALAKIFPEARPEAERSKYLASAGLRGMRGSLRILRLRMVNQNQGGPVRMTTASQATKNGSAPSNMPSPLARDDEDFFCLGQNGGVSERHVGAQTRA